jgi:hypothetical protein
MIRTPLLAALALLTAAPSIPHPVAVPETAVRSYATLEAIGWSYDEDGHRRGPGQQLRFFHDQSSSSIGRADSPDVQAILATIESARPGDPLSFRLARDAGVLVCSGRAEGDGRASGTCRFDPDRDFAVGLARRSLPPEDSGELLALTLVAAHLATVDALVTQGFRFERAGDLIAVAALGIDPAYAGELRDAGLKVDELGDLIAARALKIDAAWLRDMAGAGYPDLAIGQAIQMRALGVTPDYAMKMARVLRVVGEIE